MNSKQELERQLRDIVTPIIQSLTKTPAVQIVYRGEITEHSSTTQLATIRLLGTGAILRGVKVMTNYVGDLSDGTDCIMVCAGTLVPSNCMVFVVK